MCLSIPGMELVGGPCGCCVSKEGVTRRAELLVRPGLRGAAGALASLGVACCNVVAEFAEERRARLPAGAGLSLSLQLLVMLLWLGVVERIWSCNVWFDWSEAV